MKEMKEVSLARLLAEKANFLQNELYKKEEFYTELSKKMSAFGVKDSHSAFEILFVAHILRKYTDIKVTHDFDMIIKEASELVKIITDK